ncbi:TIGR02587 family membrane protein [Luteolibacter yonseiensis]|uniref:TIGR02587 family membrane protein n=1 Tax=Luteolibacter yonseiensis TaxID=1144680 RepID=A0A934R7G3_9BACT|nr:TIGR02587 family membrane protein [Luteolibacter yonseiensis]MBK1816855.1 TIGR02587 family membrane protein [Luteolibacter yonseiensis]
MLRFSHHRDPAESLREYGRGIAGGLMFSLPLLYTMEVWQSGFMLHPGRILIYAVTTFGLLLLYNRFAGLRRDASFIEVLIDSVEEMGIGVVLSALVLWLTGRIEGGMDLLEIFGKIVMEGMTVAIGVSVGTAQLGAPCEGDEGFSEEEDVNGFFPQLALALCGAVLFASNVAPTEEISVIAMESPPAKLLLIALFSILMGSLILQFSGFRGAKLHVARDTAMQSVRGIVSTYAVALVVSAGSLWFFGKLDGEPFSQAMAQVVVLGFPATLGASAGRLLLQVGDSAKSKDS